MIGEIIRIIDGPFDTFEGSISEVNEAKEHLKVNLEVFGRETPVDLSFLQIERVV